MEQASQMEKKQLSAQMLKGELRKRAQLLSAHCSLFAVNKNHWLLF